MYNVAHKADDGIESEYWFIQGYGEADGEPCAEVFETEGKAIKRADELNKEQSNIIDARGNAEREKLFKMREKLD